MMIPKPVTYFLGLLLAGDFTKVQARIQNTNEGTNWFLNNNDLTPRTDQNQNDQDRIPQTCEDCNCPSIYQPHCGSNGVTYPNRCTLECARNCDTGLRLYFEGVCPFPYSGRGQKVHHHQKGEVYRHRPTTPSIFVTRYPTERPTPRPTTRRPAPPSSQTPILPGVNRKPDPSCVECACTYEYAPVCASDGVVYGNMCLFQCAQRACNSYLTRQPPTQCWEWTVEDESTIAPESQRPRTITPRFIDRYGK